MSMPSSRPAAPTAAEQPYFLARNLARLGSTIPMDGTASWAPVLPGRFQPINSYVMLLPGEALMLDTGIALHRDQVLSQLTAVVPTNLPVAIFLTRAEPECAGNAGVVSSVRQLREVIAAAFRPFDSYEDGLDPSVKITALATRIAKTIPLGDRPGLSVIATRMRLLSTVWVYDRDSRTLFSSDFFGHTTVASPDALPVIDTVADDDASYESVREQILAKFWWIPFAKTQPLIDDIEDTFKMFDIETIAPTHGCILRGRAVVKKHLDLVLRVLREVPLEPKRETME